VGAPHAPEPHVTIRAATPTNSLVLDPAAFAPLDDFALRRRFVEADTGDISAHFAGRIRPLTAATAASIAEDAVARCAKSTDFTVTFRSDDSPGIVIERLQELPLAEDTQILVWWNPSTALVTDWGLFAAHWDDFCYPAADNVCIWPIAGGWTLCYRHYEVLQFRSHPRGV
jgi:hypothetical protein